MALLAGRWHTSSHGLAIGLRAFAYCAARRYAGGARFAFATWKIEGLAGFARAVLPLAPQPIRCEGIAHATIEIRLCPE